MWMGAGPWAIAGNAIGLQKGTFVPLVNQMCHLMRRPGSFCQDKMFGCVGAVQGREDPAIRHASAQKTLQLEGGLQKIPFLQAPVDLIQRLVLGRHQPGQDQDPAQATQVRFNCFVIHIARSCASCILLKLILPSPSLLSAEPQEERQARLLAQNAAAAGQPSSSTRQNQGALDPPSSLPSGEHTLKVLFETCGTS